MISKIIPPKKILFVCTINKMRSRTAHEIYKYDERFEVKSCGTSEYACIPMNEGLLNWADYIIVMEKRHRNCIHKAFPDIYKTKRIICLYIPDEYDFMQEELIRSIKSSFEKVVNQEKIV